MASMAIGGVVGKKLWDYGNCYVGYKSVYVKQYDKMDVYHIAVKVK